MLCKEAWLRRVFIVYVRFLVEVSLDTRQVSTVWKIKHFGVVIAKQHTDDQVPKKIYSPVKPFDVCCALMSRSANGQHRNGVSVRHKPVFQVQLFFHFS